ncbi:MAG: decarboxylating 6-phosphogluconate dehydrogenase [Actinobacteria bacterium]|nr:decarboxylating 6-phosphogluconate dehydrogenase [Actinomycetota bacterium]MCL6094254.1 decarboxylating 6-phosphogluconate dehydrogenase [Actinomycetota bacterium]
MKIAMIGLGKMGANMTKRLLVKGHSVVAYDISEEARAAARADGAYTADSLSAIVDQLEPPRIAWVMLPAGEVTISTIEQLSKLLSSGDIIIDGGNSHYTEAAPLAGKLASQGIDFIDAGVSGGVWGLENGYCLMVGGSTEAVRTAEPIFLALAPEGGYAHVGPVGSGHFVKMVHNGIEYGMMQAYAEGFEIMAAAKEFSLDLHEIASIWRYGSVVRSWLLELTERALAPGSGFEEIKGVVADSGEGRWTVQEAIDRSIPAPVISAALYARFASRQVDSFAGKLLAALRNQFGGHAVVTEKKGR